MICAARESHAAVILAAGNSTRLGRPKQLLTRDGETLVHRAARLAASTSPSRLIVVTGLLHAQIQIDLLDVDHTAVRNNAPDDGLASSLRAAAQLASQSAVVLICPCDLPGLEEHHLAQLLKGASGAPSRCGGTLLDGVLGVPAIVPGSWFGDMGGVDHQFGFRSRLRALPHSAVYTLVASELEFDVDTPADLQNATLMRLLDP